jgi:hypothetical protein
MKTGKLVYIKKPQTSCLTGQKVRTHLGEEGTLDSWKPPRQGQTSGRVYVRLKDDPLVLREYYPVVIGCKIIET